MGKLIKDPPLLLPICFKILLPHYLGILSYALLCHLTSGNIISEAIISPSVTKITTQFDILTDLRSQVTIESEAGSLLAAMLEKCQLFDMRPNFSIRPLSALPKWGIVRAELFLLLTKEVLS